MPDTKSFFDAIRNNDLAQVRALHSADPSLLTSRNESNVSPLLFSIYTNRTEIRDFLLASGATVDLYEAACAGDLPRVKHFVDSNPALANSFSPDGFPAFALACFFGHLEIARCLAAKGADIHATASNGTSYNALTAAVAAGRTETVQWLLEQGLDPNYHYGPGYTPLLTAAANGHVEILKLLLAHGADPNATTNDGKSAVALATERNHPEAAALLRARSASA
jgi:uncharacterized protein